MPLQLEFFWNFQISKFWDVVLPSTRPGTMAATKAGRPSPEELEAYIVKHDLKGKLESAFNQTIATLPAKPIRALVAALQTCAEPEEPAAAEPAANATESQAAAKAPPAPPAAAPPPPPSAAEDAATKATPAAPASSLATAAPSTAAAVAPAAGESSDATAASPAAANAAAVVSVS